MIMASATDISSGFRFVFNQGTFDIICSDLNVVSLSRAAAASSAVPVVLSSITMQNYGGTCNATMPAWAKPFMDTDNPPRPAARAIRSLKNLQAYGDSVHRPYLHLVDGGVADNVGMRGVSMRWKSWKRCTKLDYRRRSTAHGGLSSSSCERAIATWRCLAARCA